MKVAIVALLAACGSSHPKATSGQSVASGSGATEPDPWAAEPDESGMAAEPPAAARSQPTSSHDDDKPAASQPAHVDKLDASAQAFVDAHNRARAKHCAPPLTWSPKLAQIAQSWANELQKKGCVLGHSGGSDYGENLAAGSIGALDPESTVAMWYDEIKLYKFPSGGFSMKTGHFTQLVWTTTTQVGCGHVQCNGLDIYVCNYAPPGNWEGQYREHVLPTSCKK